MKLEGFGWEEFQILLGWGEKRLKYVWLVWEKVQGYRIRMERDSSDLCGNGKMLKFAVME